MREHPPGYRHSFCRTCGSPVPIVDREVGFAEIPAGLVDGGPGVRPLRHIYTQRKAAWYEPADALPRCGEHVPPSQHLLAALLGTSRGSRS